VSAMTMVLVLALSALLALSGSYASSSAPIVDPVALDDVVAPVQQLPNCTGEPVTVFTRGR